ncbi:FecCD family ABC transporter permease [Terrihabitans sp. B22-R8]|uniref:FecCD family ABC transporter permease n=1 Tax=Terrihabitans sp. B22-R8 TaxID=3425128 RepID=UPI00403D51EE
MKTAICLVIAIGAVMALSLLAGDQGIPVRGVIGALSGNPDTDPATRLIVLDVRLPRAVMALLVGGALAIGGVLTQSTMRNPLAEPGLLGINAGAALAVIVLIVRLGDVSHELLPGFAFGGALAATIIVYALSWSGGMSSGRIVLIGIGISALAGAGVSFVSAFGDVAAVQRAMVWMSGSVYDSRWVKIQILALWVLPMMIVVWLAARELDLLIYEDAIARSLGQPIVAMRMALLFLCAIICGAAVAAAGLIAFVGLIAPHAARRLVGPGHVILVPVSALTGALLVLAADLIGRTAIAPAQVPVGIMTALLGAPFFAYLMWKKRYG